MTESSLRRLYVNARNHLKRWHIAAACLAVSVLIASVAVAMASTSRQPTTARLQESVVREKAPARPAPNYAPAPIPYVAVQPLMYYLGSDEPVVPATAVIRNADGASVFVIGEGPVRYSTPNSYAKLTVHQERVTPGKRIGKAIMIDAGLNACAVVVVEPPSTLRDGDTISSFHEQTAEGPAIDYARLFGGRRPGVPPVIEGGIAGEQNGLLRLVITYHGDAPKGATYRVILPDDAVTEAPLDTEGSSTDVLVRKGALVEGEPVAQVQLLDTGGTKLAEGGLEPFCVGRWPSLDTKPA